MATWNTPLPSKAVEGAVTHIQDHDNIVAAIAEARVNVNAVEAAKADASHAHTWAQVTGKPATFAPAAHTHAWGEITGVPPEFDPAAHTHPIASITGLQAALNDKQAAGSYAAASHTHTVANVTGLQAALNDKQAAGSYATTASVAGKVDGLNGLAAIWTGTQAQYDALTPDSTTLYLIQEA